MRFFSQFFKKSRKPEPFVYDEDGRCIMDFDLLTINQRERFVALLPNLAATQLRLIHCNEMDSRCCMIPKYYLPEVFVMLTRNRTIERLALGEEFLQPHRFWHPRRGSRHSERNYYTYQADLEKLKHMTSLRVLELAVPENANFESLGLYLSNPACKLKRLKITHELSIWQMMMMRAVIQSASSLTSYKGFEEEIFQEILDNKLQSKVALR